MEGNTAWIGLPPGGLKRSHGDEVAVERSGKLSRYKAETSDIKHQRARAFSFLLARSARAPPSALRLRRFPLLIGKSFS